MCAKSKKTNPRRKPATKADVNAAYELGKSQTIDFVMAVSCLSIIDVLAPTPEKMQQYFDKFRANVDSVLSGEISYSDIALALKEECDLELKFSEN